MPGYKITMKQKMVLKYATGATVPDNARYLCTITEPRVSRERPEASGHFEIEHTDNTRVSHYYEVPIMDDPRYPVSGAV